MALQAASQRHQFIQTATITWAELELKLSVSPKKCSYCLKEKEMIIVEAGPETMIRDEGDKGQVKKLLVSWSRNSMVDDAEVSWEEMVAVNRGRDRGETKEAERIEEEGWWW